MKRKRTEYKSKLLLNKYVIFNNMILTILSWVLKIKQWEVDIIQYSEILTAFYIRKFILTKWKLSTVWKTFQGTWCDLEKKKILVVTTSIFFKLWHLLQLSQLSEHVSEDRFFFHQAHLINSFLVAR